MSLAGKSFLSTQALHVDEIKSVFARAKLFKSEFEKVRCFSHLVKGNSVHQKVMAMVFFEPSTRTRVSFQLAGYRIGMKSINLDNILESSIKKGETFSDTIRNVAAMAPDLMVVRYGASLDVDKTVAELKVPVINGGSGTEEHPTQALLDAFTILENRGQVEGEKILIIGDVLHSRVANSTLHLMRKLGAEVRYCSPREFQPQNDTWKDVKHFSSLQEGMAWATTCMGLRIQKERHTDGNIGLTIAEYREQFRLGGKHLESFDKEGVILHPGPVIRGVDFSATVLQDPRCKVLDQVNNGVFVRAALLTFLLDLEVQES